MAELPGRELSSIDFAAMLGGPLVAVIDAQSKAAMSSVNFIRAVGFKPGTSQDPMKPDASEPIYVTFKYPKEVAPFQPAQPAAVTGITITNAGTGYTALPAIAIAAPPAGGTQATATASLGANGSISISLDNPGSGYTGAPAVTIPAPPAGGTQAVATASFLPATAAVPAQFATMQLEVPILTMLPIPFIRIEETTIDFNAKINSVEESTTNTASSVRASLDASVKYPPLFSVASVKLKVSTSFQKNTQSGSKVDRTYSMSVHIRAVQDEMPAGMERLLGILEDAIVSKPA